MKKLIALAVAAAAMPAMASITLSGSVRVEYVDVDKLAAADSLNYSTTAAASKTIAGSDLDLKAAATTELDNGTVVSTAFEADDGDTAANLKFAASWGTVEMGNTDLAGALDAVDGVAVATARDDLNSGVGSDADVVYTLPAMVDGLTLKVSYKAEGTGADDITSVAGKYTMAGFTVFAGQDSYGKKATTGTKDDKATGYGVAYTAAGFTVGYNAAENTAGDELKGMSVGYTAGNLTLAYNDSETENNLGTVENDESTISASYNLGGGVTAFASSHSVDKDNTAAGGTNDADNTRVGFTFSF